jgi:hypothetical protein
MLRPFRFLRFVPVLAAIVLSACGDAEKSSPVRTYNLGEKFELGRITYQVFETQWLTHIGDGAEARIPQNRFFLVRLSATNTSGAELIVPTMTLQDDSTNVFNEISDGSGVPQWAGYLRSVKPSAAAQGNVVFDAPPRHYKLKVTDDTGERAALIDIPLSFGAETPDILTPGADPKEKK